MSAWHNAILDLVIRHPASHTKDRKRAQDIPRLPVKEPAAALTHLAPTSDSMTVEDAVRHFLPDLPVQAPLL
jgi:hypothetical protein